MDLSLFLLIFAGPDLPIKLSSHSMVTLGLGQAILGAVGNGFYQTEISNLSKGNGNANQMFRMIVNVKSK